MRAASTLARVAGELIGAVELIASVRLSPEERWKCLLSSDWPGSPPLKLFCGGAPNLVHKVIRQATPASQTMSVIQRCRSHARPSRPSGPGPVRDCVAYDIGISHEPEELLYRSRCSRDRARITSYAGRHFARRGTRLEY